jgi:hypothetical protein
VAKDSPFLVGNTPTLSRSGGHGVGWSEIPPYSFKVGPGWDEVPTSIADLGGAEVDLRFRKDDEGDVAVVVAPVLRFKDIGFNANVRLQELVTPEQLISGFAPELIGQPLQEGDVLSSVQVEKTAGGEKLMYYQYELRTQRVPHLLVTGALSLCPPPGTSRHRVLTISRRAPSLHPATAYKNRLYICSCNATARQWRRGEDNLRQTAQSFVVLTA